MGGAQPPESTRMAPSLVPGSPNRWGTATTTGEAASNGPPRAVGSGPAVRQALEPAPSPSNEMTTPDTGASGSEAPTTKLRSLCATAPPSTPSELMVGVVALALDGATVSSTARTTKRQTRLCVESIPSPKSDGGPDCSGLLLREQRRQRRPVELDAVLREHRPSSPRPPSGRGGPSGPAAARRAAPARSERGTRPRGRPGVNAWRRRAVSVRTAKPCWTPRGINTASPGRASMRSWPRWNVTSPSRT